jgi:hypothetical protein
MKIHSSRRVRGGAPIMTMFLDFYGDIGIMPNSSDTLNKRGFSLWLLHNFGERHHQGTARRRGVVRHKASR